jgi:hypothetical protein
MPFLPVLEELFSSTVTSFSMTANALPRQIMRSLIYRRGGWYGKLIRELKMMER